MGGASLGCPLGDLRGTQGNNACGVCVGLSELILPSFLPFWSTGCCLKVSWGPGAAGGRAAPGSGQSLERDSADAQCGHLSLEKR